MKYLTKDWLTADSLSHLDSCVRSTQKAEKTDDEYYRRQYLKKRAIYIANEKSLPFYRSPQDILKQFDALINRPDMSESGREMWTRFKESYKRMYRERIEKNIFFRFDEDKAKKRFDEDMSQKDRLCRNLPPHIKDRICDMRLFALGYASAEVKRLLKPYCAELRSQCAKAKKLADIETENAENYLPHDLNLNDFVDLCLVSIQNAYGNLYLKFNSCEILIIENAKIKERESLSVYPYDSEIPNSAWSRVLAAELHRIKRNFEIHFMIQNLKENNECEIWYLTVQGTNISKLLMIEDNYAQIPPLRSE